MSNTRAGVALAAGLGTGAGLMYFFDPDLGRRRRAILRDGVIGAWHRLCELGRAAMLDLSHRAKGVGAEIACLFRSREIPDDTVEQRVRSKMGRYVSHASRLDVSVHDGRVELKGSVPPDEAPGLAAAVGSVQGVSEVDTTGLQVQRTYEPEPNGRHRPRGERWVVMQEHWPPATRLLGALAGIGLMTNCAIRRNPVATLLGTALFLRSAANISFSRLVGVAAGTRAVDVVKSITIGAPPSVVSRFFVRFEMFPEFMKHVREVKDLGGGRSHWVVDGPAGVRASWNAVITRFEPDRLLAWRSEPGSLIANQGSVRFTPVGDLTTRVDIRLSYNPPGGALGHFAAKLFGTDPKSELDDDLLRLKSLIEDGKTSAGRGRAVQIREPVSLGAPT